MEENKIVIYQTEDGKTQIDVHLENETVWLTMAQMKSLFKSSRTNILEHSSISTKLMSWMKFQHVGNSDRFDRKANVW